MHMYEYVQSMHWFIDLYLVVCVLIYLFCFLMLSTPTPVCTYVPAASIRDLTLDL